MDIYSWLLNNADPSLVYQAARDLLRKSEAECIALRKKITQSGYVKILLDKRRADGHWGNGAYNPKWICTHYVLFELMQLGIEQDNEKCKESAILLLSYPKGKDGGVNYARTVEYSDICINGMLLSVCAYFKVEGRLIEPLIDYILKVQMKDGGWNCEYVSGAQKSSLHSTISVLEGIEQYYSGSYTYKINDLQEAKKRAVEFILIHSLFKSKTTGEIIKDDFFRFTFPIRWKYDVLRCLDYFRYAKIKYDVRMEEGIVLLEKAQMKNGIWKGYSQPGKEYYTIDRDKWNTLRAIRVLDYFGRKNNEL